MKRKFLHFPSTSNVYWNSLLLITEIHTIIHIIDYWNSLEFTWFLTASLSDNFHHDLPPISYLNVLLTLCLGRNIGQLIFYFETTLLILTSEKQPIFNVFSTS